MSGFGPAQGTFGGSATFTNLTVTGTATHTGTLLVSDGLGGTPRFAVDSSGRLAAGVPTAEMVELFEVRGTYTAGTEDLFGIRSTFTLNTPNNNKHYAAMLGQALIPAGNANNLTAWVAGVYPYLSHLGSGTLTAGMGVNAIVRFGNAAIGTEVDGYATDVLANGTSQITTLYHFKVNPSVLGGTAAIGTEYGLYVGNIASPVAANRYAIYTAGSTNKIHFGGATDVDGSITLNSAAQILASNSALAVPGLAFAAAPTTGFSWTSDYLTFVRAGVAQSVLSTGGVTLKAASKFLWSATSDPATTTDLGLSRLAASSLGIEGVTGAKTQIKQATTLLSSVSGATVTATGLIPAKAKVFGVVTRVTTGLGTGNGTTGYAVGTAGDPNLWGDVTGTTAGTDTDNSDATADPAIAWSSSAQDVVVTAAGGNFDGTGAIRVIVLYWDTGAPTS